MKTKFYHNTRPERIYISLGNGCNLRCKYCYHNDDDQSFIDYPINDDIIDWIKETCKRYEFEYDAEDGRTQIEIKFFGGEPLMYWDKVVYLTEKLKDIPNAHFAIITNGKLLTADMANYLNKNGFKVNLSWDGHKQSSELRGYDALSENRDNIFKLDQLYILSTIVDFRNHKVLFKDLEDEVNIYHSIHNRVFNWTFTIVDNMGTQAEWMNPGTKEELLERSYEMWEVARKSIIKKNKTPFDVMLTFTIWERVIEMCDRDFGVRREIMEGSDNPRTYTVSLDGSLWQFHKLPPDSQYSVKIGTIYDNYFVYLKSFFDKSKLKEQSDRVGCSDCEVNLLCKGAGPGIARDYEERAHEIRYALNKPIVDLINWLCEGNIDLALESNDADNNE